MVIPLDSVQIPYDPPTEYPDNEQDKPIDGLALVSRKIHDLVAVHLILLFGSLIFFLAFYCCKNETKGQYRELGCT